MGRILSGRGGSGALGRPWQGRRGQRRGDQRPVLSLVQRAGGGDRLGRVLDVRPLGWDGEGEPTACRESVWTVLVGSST